MGRLLLLAAFTLALAGCGHPASREECDAIFNRGAELELRGQSISDPAVIAKRTAELRAQRGEEIVSRCIGIRVTQAELDCMQRATSSQEFDKCFN